MKRILYLALALRLVWLLVLSLSTHGEVSLTADSYDYVQLAESLVEEKEYNLNGEPQLHRPPGYPVFLCLGLLLGHLTAMTLIFQIAFSVATVAGVYLLALNLTNNKKLSSMAAFLYAIEPLSIIFCGYLLTETLFAFFLIFFLERFSKFIQDKKLGTLLLSSLCLTLSMFLRPMTIYFPWILLICFVVSFVAFKKWLGFFQSEEFKKGWTRSKTISALAIFFLPAIVCPWLWVQRNVAVADAHIFTANEAIHIKNQAAATLVRVENITMEEAFKKIDDDDEIIASQILKDYPLDFAIMYTLGFIRTGFDPGSVDAVKLLDLYPKEGGMVRRFNEQGTVAAISYFIKAHPFLTALSLVFLSGLLALYFYAFKGLRSHANSLALICVFLAVMAILSGGSGALARYRHPLMPLLVILSAAGLCREKLGSQN